MTGGGIWLLGAVAAGFAIVVLVAVMKIAKDGDRAARHLEKTLLPHSDVTVTK